ncbi:putative phage-related minor tail protein [Trypoxylus dichotomus]
MSSLKRSSSASHIPRLSRISVRQSHAPRRSRSSNAGLNEANNPNLLSVPRSSRVTNTNLLSVYGSGTLGRSNSYSNLNTPISVRVQPATPSSTISSASKNFRMNDKEWQKGQLMRVKSFFIYCDPEMPPLKPLSIRTYVHSMNLLFKQLDSRISITLENYKDSVPDYLKSFKYKYNIKPSVMKTPAVPSNWQNILQIWIWLIDLIELLQDRERVLLSNNKDQLKPVLIYTSANYLADSFLAFNNKEDQDKVNSDLVNNLAQIHNIDLNDKTSSRNEESLDTELKSLLDVEQTVMASIEDTNKKVKELSDTNAAFIQRMYDRRSDLLTQIKEVNIKSRNIQSEINKSTETKQHLEAVISAQTCTKTGLRQLKDKTDEAKNIEKIKLQCINEQEVMIDDYCVKITQEKYTIQSTIHETNKKFAILSCKAPELKGIKMPDGIVDESGFQEHLTEFTENIRKHDKYFKAKLKEWKLTFHRKQQQHRTDDLERKELNSKMNEIDKTEKEHLNSYTRRKEEFDDIIREAQTEIFQKEREMEQLVEKRVNINEIKREREATLKRCADLKRMQEESIVQAGNFFTIIHAKLVEFIRENADKRKNLLAEIEGRLNCLS